MGLGRLPPNRQKPLAGREAISYGYTRQKSAVIEVLSNKNL